MNTRISSALKALCNREPVLIIHQPYAEEERYGVLVPLSCLTDLNMRQALEQSTGILVLPSEQTDRKSCAPYPNPPVKLVSTLLDQLSELKNPADEITSVPIFIPHKAGVQAQYHLPHVASELASLADFDQPFLLVNSDASALGHWSSWLHCEVHSRDLSLALVEKGGLVSKISSTQLSIPEKVDGATITVYQDASSTLDYVLLDFSQGVSKESDRWVRLHSACMTGDIFQSLHCDCGLQLKKSLGLCAENQGLLLYLPQEGRGLGLADKMKAYQLQSQGEDTVTANTLLGHDADERFFGAAVEILKDQGVETCYLISNNPNKANQLIDLGLPTKLAESFNVQLVSERQQVYLSTKQSKLNHQLGDSHE